MTHQRPLGDIAKLIRGISFPKDSKSLEPRPGDVACLRTANVQLQVEWGDLWFVPAEHVKRQEQYVQPGDILISTANSYNLVGKVAFVTATPHKSTLGAFISLIRPSDEVEPKFLYHQLAWGQTQQRIRETASTTTNISNVSTKKLAGLKLLRPSLDEQGRIVAEIEKQFSRLDEAVANLRRVKANLKRYKAAVLKAAVEGRLVETEAELARREGRTIETSAQLLQRILETRRRQWQGKGKYKEPAEPDTTNLPELPEGWVWCGFEQVSVSGKHALKAGPFGSALKKEFYAESGYKIYGQEQVISGDSMFGDYFIDEAKYRELESCAVQPGDLLISLVGTAGKVLVLPPTAAPGIINPRLLKLSLDQTHIEPAYAAYMLQSAWAKHYFKLQGHGGTMEILNLGIIKALPVPLPPRTEQHRIVAEVDRRLTLLCATEVQVEANLQRAQVLRQSVLSKAFTETSTNN
jgi:type I restriction enzyme S subunit